jgi:hypothetical protein
MGERQLQSSVETKCFFSGREGVLTSLDLDPYASGRCIDVIAGNLFDLGLDIDLLVISAFEGYYQGLPGSLVAQLKELRSIDVGRLEKALDLRGAPLIRGWVSEELRLPPAESSHPSHLQTRFRRLAVIESPREDHDNNRDWPAFNQLFCLLALLPLNGIQCQSVASPLLSAGNHGVAPERLIPALMERCRDRLRHLPDLERLVIFDRNYKAAKLLADHIDQEASRSESYTTQIIIKENDLNIEGLKKCLVNLAKRKGDINAENINNIYLQLQDGTINPVVLGTYLRRLIENLMRITLQQQSAKLHRDLQSLSQLNDGDSWIISCLHLIRVYCNWMVHDQTPLAGSRALPRAVLKEDVVMVLMALHRALKAYPWIPAHRKRTRTLYPDPCRKLNKPIRSAADAHYSKP